MSLNKYALDLLVSRDIEKRFLRSQSLVFYGNDQANMRFCKVCVGRTNYDEEEICYNDFMYYRLIILKQPNETGRCSCCNRKLHIVAEFFSPEGGTHSLIATNVSSIPLHQDEVAINLDEAVITFYDLRGARYCSLCCGQTDYNMKKIMFAGNIFVLQQVSGLITEYNCANCFINLPIHFNSNQF